jgi:hypothetical protein
MLVTIWPVLVGSEHANTMPMTIDEVTENRSLEQHIFTWCTTFLSLEYSRGLCIRIPTAVFLCEIPAEQGLQN